MDIEFHDYESHSRDNNREYPTSSHLFKNDRRNAESYTLHETDPRATGCPSLCLSTPLLNKQIEKRATAEGKRVKAKGKRFKDRQREKAREKQKDETERSEMSEKR